MRLLWRGNRGNYRLYVPRLALYRLPLLRRSLHQLTEQSIEFVFINLHTNALCHGATDRSIRKGTEDHLFQPITKVWYSPIFVLESDGAIRHHMYVVQSLWTRRVVTGHESRYPGGFATILKGLLEKVAPFLFACQREFVAFRDCREEYRRWISYGTF
jgi:hypothetical protein